jgi:Tfp pilus assembly protein PilX
MVNINTNYRNTLLGTPREASRSGAALLFSMFIIAFMTLMVINVLDSTTLELSALRNSMDYQRALFLANAGVHEVAAQLEAASTWTGTITDGSYPADDTYEAVAVSGANYTVIVTSVGVAGESTRTVQAVIEL